MRSRRIATVPSNWPMPDLVSRQDRVQRRARAVASDARNRLLSNCGDRVEDSRRHCRFVAHGGPTARLLLRKFVDAEQKPGAAPSRPSRRLGLRGRCGDRVGPDFRRSDSSCAEGPAVLGRHRVAGIAQGLITGLGDKPTFPEPPRPRPTALPIAFGRHVGRRGRFPHGECGRIVRAVGRPSARCQVGSLSG
jgi:hypothetical protein